VRWFPEVNLQSDISPQVSWRAFIVYLLGITWGAAFIASYIQEIATYHIMLPPNFTLVSLPLLLVSGILSCVFVVWQTAFKIKLGTRNVLFVLSIIAIKTSLVSMHFFADQIGQLQLIIFSFILIGLGLFLFLWSVHYQEVVRHLSDSIHKLWQQRQIIYTWVYYDLEAKYVDSFLGLAWVIIEPIMMALVYAFAFSSILGIRPTERGDLPAGLFVFCSVIVWRIFSQSLNQGANFIISKRMLVTQLPVPLDVLGIMIIMKLLVDYCVSFVVLIGTIYLFGLTAHPVNIWIPLLLAIILVIAAGLVFLMGSLGCSRLKTHQDMVDCSWYI
jgi:hypothetical protein